MTARRIPVDELTRLAFIHGEQDRRSYAESWPKDAVESILARNEADQMHRYRMKRWGKTQGEADMEKATLIDAYTGNPVKRHMSDSFAVCDRHGRIASRAIVGLDWLPPTAHHLNFLTWDTREGAQKFASMNGGQVVPMSEVENAGS